MTEAEWLAATEPSGLTRFLCDVQGLNRKPNGRRKLRLFACACGRRAWHLLDDNRSREAVEIAERYADGVVSKAALERIWNRKQPRFLYWALCDQIGPAVLQTPHEASFLLALAADHKMEEGYREAESAEQSMQVTLLRDI